MPIRYVIHARDVGFFSNFNAVVNRLYYTVGPSDLCEVNWSLDRLFHSGTGEIVQQTEFPYGNRADGNVWNRFFEPLLYRQDPANSYATRHLWRWHEDDWYFGTQKAWGTFSCNLYRPNNQQWRSVFHEVYRRHIRPSQAIRLRVARFRSRYLNTGHCVGVHIRNSLHSIEQAGNAVFKVYHFKEAIRRLYGKTRPTIFLATDKDQVVQEMQEAFGDAVVYQKDVLRTPMHEEDHVHHNRQGDLRLGHDVLSDALLLAGCQRIIHTTSNIATAIGYINPNIDMHYIGGFEKPKAYPKSRLFLSRFLRRAAREMIDVAEKVSDGLLGSSLQNRSRLRRISLKHILLASPGCSGTHMLRDWLQEYGWKYVPQDILRCKRKAMRMSQPTLIATHWRAVSIPAGLFWRTLYTVAHPCNVVLSAFRRRSMVNRAWASWHAQNMQANNLPVEVDLEAYLQGGHDYFQLERHYREWLQLDTGGPKMAIKYEHLWDEDVQEELCRFLELPENGTFPGYLKRNSDYKTLSNEPRRMLEEICGSAIELYDAQPRWIVSSPKNHVDDSTQTPATQLWSR